MFIPKKTLLHSLDPRAKAVMLVFYTVASIILISPLAQLALLLSTVPLAALAKGLKRWWSTLKAALLLATMILVMNIIISPEYGIIYATATALRFLVLTSSFSVFFLTTTPEDLALALESSGLSRDYALMITMSLRFVPTLARDLQIVVDSFRSRGLKLDSGGIRDRIKSYATILTPLIVFEVKRSLMVAEALEARGFGSTTKRTLYKRLRLTVRDCAFSSLWLIALVAVIILKALGILV